MLMLKKLEPIQEELFGIDTNIQELNNDLADTEYLDNALATLGTLYEKIDLLIIHSHDSSMLSGRNTLSNINLPNFKDAYENWSSFHDTYLSLIHKDQALTNIEKFHFLKSSLVDEVARTI